MVIVDAPRSNPDLLKSEDVEDLSTYFRITPESCLKRLQEYSTVEMAERWRAADPKTPEEVVEFYRSADLYIWELMQSHASTTREWARRTLAQLLTQYPPSKGFRRVLEFGCGVGSDSLYLARHGYEVTLADIPGPAFKFAQHRFHRRAIDGQFLSLNGSTPEIASIFDIIICFDVFEHLQDPLGTARALARSLRPGGVLAQSVCFEDSGIHPCHLQHNLRRFEGARWHIHLAGLGFRHRAGLIYEHVAGPAKWMQAARYIVWQRTGFWVSQPTMLRRLQRNV